jgi:hypothetical protein
MELFPLEETLSPRLLWMRNHSIRTYHNPEMSIPWMAICEPREADDETKTARADSEDAALVELAKKLNLKLWNGA